MEAFDKLKELEMTTDEIHRFSEALKDEKFREMLHKYAEEISDPENKKKYEAEITQLEQNRGMEVKFIHPKPHHVLKTSVNGKEKCFINICSNNLINKPTCQPKRADNGQIGQFWSLPYSLTPGRPDRDSKGNKCTLYDVVFHPDTLYMADKSAKFMKLINKTAMQGVEDAFKVKLDKPNIRFLKMQYKGVPHPAVTRKPIPGHIIKDKTMEEPFPIPYPDSVSNDNAKPATAPTQKHSSPTIASSSLPTQPHYTVKHRSVVDLQDYRCSRDSAPSPRPKEIIVTVDLPLLKSAAQVDLNVRERNLVLESEKPAYKLELLLSYPVNDDHGVAKFNKAKKQLIITLPVKPPIEPAEVYTEGNQPGTGDEPDEVESENRVEMLCDTRLDKDEQSALNITDSQPLQEKEKEHEVKLDSEMNPDPSHLARADVTHACKETNPNTSSSKDNAVDKEPENSFSPGTSVINHHTEEIQRWNANDTRDCRLVDKENLCLSDMLPTIYENETHSALTDETVTTSQLVLTSAELHPRETASHFKETMHDVQNETISPSHCGLEKNEIKLSVVSEEPSKLNLALAKDTTISIHFHEETETLHEEPNSFTRLSATEDKDIKSAVLVEDKVVPVNEHVISAQASKESKCDFTINPSVILKEKNTKDGSEVVISNHATSAAVSFQNSLCFELD